MSDHDLNYGEGYERDLLEALRDERDREAEFFDSEREAYWDRLRRDDAVRTVCGTCGDRPGKALYGMRCSSCWDAWREEMQGAA